MQDGRGWSVLWRRQPALSPLVRPSSSRAASSAGSGGDTRTSCDGSIVRRRLGDWSYEAIDTKLARSVKPYFVLQLCFYSELLAELQGTEPEHMYVVLGTGEEKSLRYADFSAYYRRLKAEFASALSDGLADIYPEPVAHCGLCRWSDLCDARWEQDDHLSLVARLARTQLIRLSQAGIKTVAELARATPEQKPSRIGRGHLRSSAPAGPVAGRPA